MLREVGHAQYRTAISDNGRIEVDTAMIVCRYGHMTATTNLAEISMEEVGELTTC